MPNWCNNSIEIVGPRDKIRALWTQATRKAEEGKEDPGLLGAMRPEPNYDEVDVLPTYPNIVGNSEPVDKSQSWWDWRVQNWGTKWEISNEGLEYEEDADGNFAGDEPYARITGWFDSAWSPPVDAMNYYAEQNPDVRITLDYHEPGMCFVGRAEFCDGEMGLDDYYDYSGFDSKTVRDAIGADMDDMWAISENMAEWEEENSEEA